MFLPGLEGHHGGTLLVAELGTARGFINYLNGLYRDNGKENGNPLKRYIGSY